jgi:hypothetical protein
MDKRRGGCAPNIAYTLALLGERPRLMGTAGQDFDDYRRWLEAAGVDTVARQAGRRQVHRVVLLQHRLREQPDRVVLHRRDGQRRELSFRDAHGCTMAIISPNDPQAMIQYAEECRTLEIPYIWDPGQQCARMGGDELAEGLRGSRSRSATTTIRVDPQKTGLRRGRPSWRRPARSSSRAASTDAAARRARTKCPSRPCRLTASSIPRASATRSAAVFSRDSRWRHRSTCVAVWAVSLPLTRSSISAASLTLIL